jgi:putative tricarboxylic transport membrane protein
VTFNTFDIFMMILIAVCALVLRLLGYPMAPLLLGFILGGLMEDNLRRSLAIYDGSMSFLWERPLTLGIMLLTAVVLAMPFIGPSLKKFIGRAMPFRTGVHGQPPSQGR